MARRCLGFVVSGNSVTAVDTTVPDDDNQPITIVADLTWQVQTGDRAAAYSVLHQTCADYLNEHGIDLVVVKASAVSTRGATRKHLLSAEVRGVVIAAAASICSVQVVEKAVISRTFGKRKVDEYLKDNDFWHQKLDGSKLRKTSREAAMLVLASRDR